MFEHKVTVLDDKGSTRWQCSMTTGAQGGVLVDKRSSGVIVLDYKRSTGR
jgi:hypothetical protein